MQVRTLILGALPLPGEGPWVGISDRRRWSYVPKVDYRNRVEIQVEEFAAVMDPLRFGLRDHPLEIHGHRARAVIIEPVPGVDTVTIELVNRDGR